MISDDSKRMTGRETARNLVDCRHLAPRGYDLGVHYVDLALFRLVFLIIFVVVEIAVWFQNEPTALPTLNSLAWENSRDASGKGTYKPKA